MQEACGGELSLKYLHGVGVCLPDVLIHLQDGPAMQGELPFLLWGRKAGYLL